MSLPDNRGADIDTARARFIGLFRVSSWTVLVLVAGASLWRDPRLAVSPVFIGLVGAYVMGVLLVGRTRLVAADERRRLLLEATLACALLAAICIVAGAAARSLELVLVLPVAFAPLLIGIRQARVVLAAAIAAVSAIAAAAAWRVGWAALAPLVVAGVLFVFVHYVMAQLVQLFAAMRQRMLTIADHDALTGAYNLDGFLVRAERAHQEAAAARKPYGVLIVDIDNLKAINERFGHAAGSRALRLVAMALERLCNPEELTARYDGDKLAVLVPRLEGSRAAELAQRIRNVVFATTLNVDTQVVRIKANVGLARYPIDATTLDALLIKAEADMRVDRAGREPPKKKPVFKRRSGTKTG